ncbi:Methylated-DNA--protein-cysteine methyltransferase [Leptospirillum ferriphilum]|jgi:methylated-DNA-[protein]-cysteine S-methyltransferase|uniref:Methylated-DNA--protein-cysteine methyltransferase n=3 Tax=Leptospirillum TaxID=179 RepID=A0A094W5V8_9BACT|nr:methylated-DNA--[protein]-cysteine S-methyltransferase [Leptospirillum ferriphilum]AFS53917.1 methylated DNA-protein cysteine methyltransferase [Leptospirillum ferriphilum ML-04]EDZ38265.1 MAG: Methylated-DNA-(protein)-cysteine S- methyltransferase [Leptospirillum sp. Group II '5-way CG']KGA92858.1 Methylated-DNA--protein-cysteine methyltransferase [Leptospirillum ferriphilum]OOH73585.1 hypothetical protein BOX24_03655 [Leptospirillum ferriphilum]
MNSGYIRTETSLGPVIIVSEGEAVTAVVFDGTRRSPDMLSGKEDGQDDAPLSLAAVQIREYLEGQRREFRFPVRLSGTPFQRDVWEILRTIPYGKTLSYRDITRLLEKDDRYLRAVGSAISRNPLMMIVPCHRVIGSDGSLTGYAGGLDRKRALLELEQRHMPR